MLLQVPCVCHDTPLSLAILKLPSYLNQRSTDAATEAQKRHGPASAPNKVEAWTSLSPQQGAVGLGMGQDLGFSFCSTPTELP